MTRPAARPSANIQQEPPAAATEPAAPAEAPKSAALTWGWRVALFIWACAFLCLVAYELLNTVVRSFYH
jgi:hypothetical protein